MFESTTVTGRVFTDETGIHYEVPVLLTPEGPVDILIDYLIDHWDGRSPQWMVKVTASVRLFLEYLEAHSTYLDEQAIFQNFRQRLLTGSVNAATGSDDSGLWWKAQGPENTRRILTNLTDFFGWWAKRNPGKATPAPLPRTSRYDLRLAEAAFMYRRNQAFLGHTWSTFEEASRKPGNHAVTNKWHATPRSEKETEPSFPEDRVLDLVLKGFKVGERYNYRDMLITLLLNGAGYRESEPFHLYLWDVTEDPHQKNSALVLIHHPAWGNAPKDPSWRDATGQLRNGRRVEYLAERFGMAPRDWGLSTSAAGWKGGMHEKQFGGYYKQAYWFVPEFGELFWRIWNLYVQEVQRIAPALRNHPFAFVNTMRDPKGDVYKMGKFEDSHAAAVRRIGLIPAKHLGTSIHGHRHAYGQRLRKAGVPKETIRRFMHHAAVESQDVYTQPDRAECMAHIAQGVQRLNDKSARLRDDLVGLAPHDVSNPFSLV
ncbi:MAG: site-specific integrase [Alcaligenaceae bacterium]|uniref:gamma-mobile-trio recombinase GmtY n=1 Tax=Curvibacter soli TaxID=3031331 RepID=UPI0010E519C9|nr:gamma-mobile-trio recombinase GmtY [Ramlibacter sp. H39-3-26]MDF1484116.1 gamma-mobile-trio recombinase GmtY [Ramlibacter sp. H39-3-26]RYH62664.1 MAG: site-specific integrase [Alcaligenaceae bacterium]